MKNNNEPDLSLLDFCNDEEAEIMSEHFYCDENEKERIFEMSIKKYNSID